MARLLLIALFIGAIVAIAVMLRSLWTARAAQGGSTRLPPSGPFEDDAMAPTTLQKISYLALIAVLLGTTSGLVGGM